MSQDFNTFDKIELKPNDYKVEYTFDFPACTGASENDGALPVGTVIDAVSASAFTEGDVPEAGLIVGSPSVLNNIVSVSLKYPDGGVGRYYIDFILADGAITFDLDFQSIFALE